LPQVQQPRRWDADSFSMGLMLIRVGILPQVRHRRQLRHHRDARVQWQTRRSRTRCHAGIGVYAFAWQIYGDFSG